MIEKDPMKIAALLIGAFLVGCEGEPDAAPPAPFLGIVNGTPTDYRMFQDAVMVETVYVRCTGTLIHPKVVLTAAHCIWEIADGSGGGGYDLSERPSNVRINVGAEGKETVSDIERIVMHPGWDGAISTDAPDLAMLLLTDEIGDIAPRKLADFPMPEAGDGGMIVGYGADPEDVDASGPLHRMGKTALLDVTPYYFEIGGATNTCSGDSGGPLYVEQNDDWVLVGVTSFGPADCPAESQGYSVNLLSYCDWLNDTTASLTGDDLGLTYCKSCVSLPVSSWGGPCGTGYPCCPEGTACRYPDGFSENGLGFCAPSCCALGEAESDICSDIALGDESCAFSDSMGADYCAIHCDEDGDCPQGTACKNKPFESERICIAKKAGDEATCVDTEISDTEESTAGDFDTDTATDSRPGDKPVSSNCSCLAPGHRGPYSLLGILMQWIQIIL